MRKNANKQGWTRRHTMYVLAAFEHVKEIGYIKQ